LSHRDFLGTRVFSSLDGLRALAIVAVVWHHTGGSDSHWIILKRGFLGVDLFFLISGFLIATLILRERHATGDVSLLSFYRRRCLRIFPANWLMLAIFASIAFLKPNPSLRHDLPFAALYLSNFVVMLSALSITWSLAAEEQFYLVIPALQKYAHRSFHWFLPLLYVAAVVPTFGWFPSVPAFFKETTFGPILLGVMLAYVLDDSQGWNFAARLVGHSVSPALALVLVLTACAYPASDISGWPRMTIHFALLTLLASCVVREQQVLRPLLTWGPVRRIGVVSYGIYLYHMLALGVMLKAHQTGARLFFGTLTLSWIIAEVSFRTFEAKFLARKNRAVQPPERNQAPLQREVTRPYLGHGAPPST
jgi:peptidoglycan/LPS O-acetylase OafA/YrhL